MNLSWQTTPLLEAVVELRSAQPISKSAIARIKNRLANDYPVSDAAVGAHIQLDALAGKASLRIDDEGFRLTTVDALDVAIVQKSHLTASRLAPYLGWEFLRGAASRLIDAADGQAPFPLSRVGMRFIRRLDVPLEASGINLERYLKIYPQYPEMEGATPSKAAVNLELVVSDRYSVTLNAAIGDPPLIGLGAFFVDIDIGLMRDLPEDKGALLTTLDEMEALHDKAFDACVTEEARKLYQ